MPVLDNPKHEIFAPEMTDAVNLLSRAQDRVADHVEGHGDDDSAEAGSA
jgi:hypothetical protein